MSFFALAKHSKAIEFVLSSLNVCVSDFCICHLRIFAFCLFINFTFVVKCQKVIRAPYECFTLLPSYLYTDNDFKLRMYLHFY